MKLELVLSTVGGERDRAVNAELQDIYYPL